MKQRLENLQAMMVEKGIEAVYIKSKENKRYFGSSTGSGVALFVSLNKAIAIVDGRYTAESTEKAQLVGGVEVLTCERGKNWPTALKLAKEWQLKVIAIEEKVATIAEYVELQAAGFGYFLLKGEIEALRAIKNEAEIALVKQACLLTDEIMAQVLQGLKSGTTELAILGKIYALAFEKGAEGLAFDPIIASGERGALPHGRATTKTIAKGELLTIDFGLTWQGYQSDITRTVAIGKNIDSRLIEIYHIVLKAHNEAILAIKSGLKGYDIDAVAREVITKAGYGNYFVHGLGHGIGMGGGGEEPMLNSAGFTTLQNGMIMSCEPGIYIPGLGGVRIEDDILIENNVGVSLNKTPKELLFLEG